MAVDKAILYLSLSLWRDIYYICVFCVLVKTNNDNRIKEANASGSQRT